MKNLLGHELSGSYLLSAEKGAAGAPSDVWPLVPNCFSDG